MVRIHLAPPPRHRSLLPTDAAHDLQVEAASAIIEQECQVGRREHEVLAPVVVARDGGHDRVFDMRAAEFKPARR